MIPIPSKATIYLAIAGLFIAGAGGLYLKGLWDGEAKERAAWEKVQRDNEIKQAANRRAAEKEISNIERQLAKIQLDQRAKVQAVQQELTAAQNEYENELESTEDELAQLQKIIIALEAKDVAPEIIEKIKVIRSGQPSTAERRRAERLRNALNSVR